MKNVIDLFLLILGIYIAIGLLFAIFFVFVGGTKIDPLLKDSKKRVRIILLPGIVAIWPFLAGKLFKSKKI